MQKMPSVGQHDFSRVPSQNMPRSKFDRSHGYKTTLEPDLLYPVFCDELLPGDTINLKTDLFGRINTLIFPLMDNIKVSIQYFAVPNRLLWSNWEKFMGAQDDPGDSVDFLVPTVNVPGGGYAEGSIYDYMGIPTLQPNIQEPNAFHMRAYNKIISQWYRDENLIDSRPDNTGNGSDSTANYDLQKRNKAHDYFTSCLPFPQKGDAVTLPLGTTANVITQEAVSTGYPVQNGNVVGAQAYIDDPGGNRLLYADLTTATAATVDELIEAFAIQALYRSDARGGTRYTEIVLSHFKVNSPDARMQRAEYLGGGSSDLRVQEIAQTSSTDGTSPQANMSAQGKIMYQDKGFSYSATEHCVVLGLLSITADITYQQGLNKMWTRQTKLDYYFPDLAHLGEQAVLNQEIYADGSANDALVFGYQERWAEYRYFPSIITGKFRSNATGTLDPWHLSQDFSSLPVLDQDFIENNMPIDRIVAVTSEPAFTIDMWFNYHHDRPIPTYSIPGLAPRF